MFLRYLKAVVAGYLCASAHGEQIVFDDPLIGETAPLNIAVIGAGAAGASSAYHLAQYAKDSGVPVNITIFDRNSFVGGRSTTVYAYNDSSLPFELGGSIFVKVNHVLMDAVEAFNLTTSLEEPASRRASSTSDIGPALAVWDGQRFVITQNTEGGWWDLAKLFYKYGLSPLRTVNLMKSVVGKFLQMYEEPIFPFSSLTQAAQDVGLLAITSATGEQYLRENNIGTPFARDIVQASTRVNYAQNLGYIHGLETMVCMAAEGAMAVEGGNWQIFAQMIAASKATTHLETNVTAIEKQPDGSYHVQSKHRRGSGEATASLLSNFDEVILAAPYQYTGIDLDATAHKPDSVPYVELHVTIFTSPHLLSPAFFGMPSNKPAPRVIVTTLPPDEHPSSGPEGVGSPGFFSISLLDAVANPKTGAEEYAYKIFSPSPPNSTFLSSLLGVRVSNGEISKQDITWIFRKVWNSYPYEFPRVTFEEIKLDDSLWYTSGIESFISTMETSAFMGKNVARLVVNEWIERATKGR